MSYELKEGNGTIQEFDYNGKLIFKGEYLNGKRNGKGKEYDINGKLILKILVIMIISQKLQRHIIL